MPTYANIPATDAAVLDAALDVLRALGEKADTRRAQVHLHYGGQTVTRTAQIKRNLPQANLGTLDHQLTQRMRLYW